jgi:hypothetical protein
MKKSLLLATSERLWPGRGGACIEKTRAWLFLLVPVILLTLVILPLDTWASPPQVVVEVIPDKVEIPLDGEVRALVVTRNLSTRMLEDVRLSWFAYTHVRATIEPTGPGHIEPQGTLTWVITLSEPDEFLDSETVHLQVDYSWETDDGSGAVPGVAFSTLEINGPAREAAEKIVDVQIKTTLQALSEQQPGEVFLIIKNISNVAIRVTDVLPDGPEFITFQVSELEKSVTLAPGESKAVPVVVKAKDVVRPGNHLLLFDVRLEWERAGRSQSGNLILSREVEVGILGESEILKALAVPSFLLLPGFLMIVGVGLLWKLGRSTQEFPLKVSSPEFWLVAITLSILMAAVYPIATQYLTGVRRSYLEGYGLIDVIQVWLSSIILAFAVYVGAMGTRNLASRALHWVRSVKQGRKTPSKDDDPVTLLKKLHRQNLGVRLDRVVVNIQEVKHFAFVLERPGEAWETLWVGPSITVEWLEGADVELRMQVDQQLGEKGSAAALAALLKRGQREGALRVTWKRMNQLVKPYLAEKADILSFEPPNFLIEQE